MRVRTDVRERRRKIGGERVNHSIAIYSIAQNRWEREVKVRGREMRREGNTERDKEEIT